MNTSSSFPFFTLLMLLAMVGACATPVSVTSDWDPGTRFSALQTWAWLEESETRWQSAGVPFDSLLDARIREAVERELGNRGFRRVESGQPDFLVAYHAAVAAELEVRTLYRGSTAHGWGATAGRDTRIRQIRRGSLVLDFLDPETRRLVWRGLANARLRPAPSPAQRTQQVNRAVEALLERFPPS